MNTTQANRSTGGIFYIVAILVILFSPFPFSTIAQNLNAEWEKELTKSLDQFLDCAKTSADKYSCIKIGQTVATVYHQEAFYSKDQKRYLAANEIPTFLKQNDRWTLLGPAYDQKVLDASQEFANANKPVIAVYTSSTGSHVVLILPGDLHYSGTWGCNVPNSASFAVNDPSKSYVGKGLSYGFSKSMMKSITLYCRK
jgi:hypothetical protein